MNKETLTQSAIEAERKAVDAVINILLIFIFGLVAFVAGYYVAMSEAAALVKTI
ncbi:MAG: hypothetical protein WKF90_10960 [Pyrinomonadaceae bacterium]